MNNYYSFFVISVLVFGLISTPFSFAQSNQGEFSNLGQEVSDFVHESRQSFEEQKVETKGVIAQCREDLEAAEPSEREAVREDCRTELEKIKESYKSIRETYRDTFLVFKESMKVLIAVAKGVSIDEDEINEAILEIESLADVAEKRELLKELRKQILEEIREEAHQLREIAKKERELVREEFKTQEKELREEFKAERESLREQEKILREQLKEARSDQEDDDDHEDEDYIITGLVSSVDLVLNIFQIKGNDTDIYVNNNTEFDDFDSLEDIKGFNVKVEIIQSSNSLIAKEIEVEDEEYEVEQHAEEIDEEDDDDDEEDDD